MALCVWLQRGMVVLKYHHPLIAIPMFVIVLGSIWALYVLRVNQWETSLHCNVVFHWLSPYQKISPVPFVLYYHNLYSSMRSFVLFSYISDIGPSTEHTAPLVSYMQTLVKLSWTLFKPNSRSNLNIAWKQMNNELKLQLCYFSCIDRKTFWLLHCLW